MTAVLVILSLLSCTKSESDLSTVKSINVGPPARIISLAPSVTEILYELELEDHVVGVTRYCDYPPRALEKSSVGGYFDVNYEAVLALEPDLVICLIEHEDALKRLGDLGVETLAVDHSRVEGILRSITVIAGRCGAQEMGQDLRCDLENRMQEVQSSLSPASGRSRPRVLLAVGRSLRSGAVGEVYVSGRDGFYNDLINLAGGENAYREETLKFPALSAEGLALLDPDVIVEMIPDLSPGDDPALLMSYWRNLPALKAVQERRVHILVGDHVVIPGPRFILLLEEMREVISRIHETGSRRQEDSPGSKFNVQRSKFKVQGITSVQK